MPKPPDYDRDPPKDALGDPLPDPFLAPSTPTNPRNCRQADGSYNDFQDPNMGRLCSRYARNFPFEDSYPSQTFETDLPNPRRISNELMRRDTFRPATSLNVLAAAWIQFNVHDWARHMPDTRPEKRIRVPADPAWQDLTRSAVMEIDRTLEDRTRPSGCPAGPPTFRADGTFWWEGSQIYGSKQSRQDELRRGIKGHLKLTRDKWGDWRLPDTPPPDRARDPNKPSMSGIDQTGFMSGWWAGLSVLHTLFSLEHNAICDELIRQYPSWMWDDERVFQTARLINAALIAKIQTVEWTPAILNMPIMKVALESNWWGVLGKKFHQEFGRIGDSEALSGILGSPRDHHGVSFGFTEEFVSIYRLHPLIPDTYRFHSLGETSPTFYDKNRNPILIDNFGQIEGRKTRAAIDAIRMENVIYSFGLAHPGAVTLGNFPHFLRRYEPPDQPGRYLDLATIDIVRDRERGIPRYNRFRQLLRMPRVKSFEQLNPQWADKMGKLYKNVDEVDTMVGLFAEEPPPGFGFSDTAFRIFILMASRRLKSDRFYTTEYGEEVYTKVGLDWINDNSFESVLLRHYPALAPAVRGLDNPFRPWQPVHESTVV
jgi:hypothetical protein